MPNDFHLRSAVKRHRDAGFTLIELLVALALGLLVAGAAVAALLVGRNGFNSVDSGSQLRENVRFAASVLTRIVDETGFQNVSYGAIPVSGQAPPMRGYDNAAVAVTQGSTVAPTFTASAGVNSSDVLDVSFIGSSVMNANGTAGAADGSMINCAGVAVPQNQANPARSIFHVITSSSGEPTLACTYQDPTSGAWFTVALVSGVESFQLLYGTDGVTVNTAPPQLNLATSTNADSVPERYMTAPQLTVNNNLNDPGTLDNWRLVRSIRVGMVLRGPPNAVVDRNATAQAYAVLGNGFTAAADPGSTLTIATPDGRLRHQVAFTIHLRNTMNTDSLLPLP